ncbi:MAG: glycoside hydrolase family 3 protein [Sphingomonadales bacterium]|nr:glycoside hydrolase family 3 protein [Sphingomonadales bacterium]
MKTRVQFWLAAAAVLTSAAIPPTVLHARAPTHEDGAADGRARAALARMSLTDKIALINGEMPLMLPKAQRPEDLAIGAGYVPGNEALGVPPQVSTDASLGVSNLMDMRKGDVATALPSGLALAATWNPDLLYQGGRMIGSEARAKGFNVMLAGGVNLVRDPRAGRNFEYLGEDPLLAGRLVGREIAGIQSNRMIATIKHFALNDQETGRSSGNVVIDEAAARESDLLAFQIGIEEGDPGSVMCAYNLIGGKFACENEFLLNQVLRRDWRFKGFVMSDWGAVHSTESLLAGLDQQSAQKLDRKRWFSTELEAALKNGRVPMRAVDTAVLRILRTLYARDLDGLPPAKTPIDYAANGKVAQAVAEQGTVLLRNEGGILPIASAVRRIVVIGGHADIGVLSGAGSSQVVPVGGFKLVEPITEGPARMFGRRAFGGTPPLEALRAALPGREITYVDGRDPTVAVEAARQADAAIVFGEKFQGEAFDSPNLALDGKGDALIAAVAAANPRTIAVLEIGNPVLMPWRDRVAAILVGWYPGQRGGDALAAIIAGTVNPSGRLPATFPAGIEQLPNPVLPGSNLPPPSKDDRAIYGINTNSPPFEIHYPEGSDAGYRWYDRKRFTPLYPFGYGLNYTRFGYDRLVVTGGNQLEARFRVTNTGARDGTDVAQIYITLPGKARRLAGWSRVALKPGESRTITIAVDPRILANFDAARQRWVVSPGEVRVELSRAATMPVIAAKVRISGRQLRP